MGSPYFVHQQINRVHVVRSVVGLNRIVNVVKRSMGCDVVSAGSPEWVVLNDIYSAFRSALASSSRSVVFLESRYEWRGWEKFQRVIIFDFSGKPSIHSDTIPNESLTELFGDHILEMIQKM